jgi:intracellular septation protein A
VHVFAIVLMLALGVMLIGRWVDELVPILRRFTMFTVVVLGVLTAWFADFDVWEQWAVPVRENWIGVVLTGALLGGLAHAWHVVLGFVSGVTRKTNDEAEALERSQTLKAA